MVDLSLGIYMLSWPDNHGLGRGDVGKGSLARVSVWNPYRDGESIRSSAKDYGDCTGEV